jgi:ubiquinone/menaquinone biosynthesis C-methylase UbiE
MILYKQLANYYDKFYYIKNYKNEVDFILEIFKRYKIKMKSILDVACGTGNHANLLASKGFNIVGVDLNEEILKIARKKVKKGVFVKGDMKNLNTVVSGEYDAALLLFNSILYNTNKHDFMKTLKGIYNHLRKGGVFIFDLFTEQNFFEGSSNFFFEDKKSFGFKHVKKRIKGKYIEISNYYLIKDGNTFIASSNNINKLGIFSEKEVKLMMKNQGFKVKIFHDWSFKKKKSKTSIFVGFKT